MGRIYNVSGMAVGEPMAPSLWLGAPVCDGPYRFILESPAGGEMEVTEEERLLLAAAPELLAACEATLANLTLIGTHPETLPMRMLTAAIRKAKGET